jgi:hypothetical protein
MRRDGFKSLQITENVFLEEEKELKSKTCILSRFSMPTLSYHGKTHLWVTEIQDFFFKFCIVLLRFENWVADFFFT